MIPRNWWCLLSFLLLAGLWNSFKFPLCLCVFSLELSVVFSQWMIVGPSCLPASTYASYTSGSLSNVIDLRSCKSAYGYSLIYNLGHIKECTLCHSSPRCISKHLQRPKMTELMACHKTLRPSSRPPPHIQHWLRYKTCYYSDTAHLPRMSLTSPFPHRL